MPGERTHEKYIPCTLNMISHTIAVDGSVDPPKHWWPFAGSIYSSWKTIMFRAVKQLLFDSGAKAFLGLKWRERKRQKGADMKR